MPFDKINTTPIEKKLIHKAQTMSYRDKRRFYINLGIIGVFAGHIIVPLLLGVWLGGWLDEHYPHPTISWRLNLIFIGLIIGLPLTTLIISYYCEFVLHQPNPLHKNRKKELQSKKAPLSISAGFLDKYRNNEKKD